MHLYLATSFFLLRSPRARLIALCVVAVHLPLLGYMGWGVATGRIAMAEFALIAGTTAITMATALLGVGTLRSPRHRLADRHAPAPAQRPVQRPAAAPDPPPGIASRQEFLARLDVMPDERRHGCVAIVEIDHVGRIGDPQAGDAIVGAFAGRLSAQLRRIDRIARWGEASFALVFQDWLEDEASWTLARIAGRMRTEPIGEVDGRRISFSAGLCAWTGGPAAAPLAGADAALDDARRAGRDRICRAARQPRLLDQGT